MHTYNIIYEFAASAGALEGFVYKKAKIGPGEIKNWVSNLTTAYKNLPKEVIEEFQQSLDGTLGRAIRSLLPILGEDHEHILSLKSMIAGELPCSADDFQKRKWFDKR
jgi:hypothetical protein